MTYGCFDKEIYIYIYRKNIVTNLQTLIYSFPQLRYAYLSERWQKSQKKDRYFGSNCRKDVKITRNMSSQEKPLHWNDSDELITHDITSIGERVA